MNFWVDGDSCDDISHEHVKGEVNISTWCDECAAFSKIMRDPRALGDGSVYVYDPLCGKTYVVKVAQA